MARFQDSYGDAVALIKQRLEHYDFAGGSTVVREILQNADDAGASELKLALLAKRGLENADCTLLRGPALVAVNDGPFEPRHRKGLMARSTGSKASQADAIGRFGIGQQSVFHICEAFCFLGQSETGELGEILNPWEGEGGDEHQRTWVDFTDSDKQRMRTALGLEQEGNWFALWLPLRLESHSHPGSPIIRHDDLLDNLSDCLADEREFGILLAQLANVKTVQRLKTDGPRVNWNTANTVGQLDEGFHLRSRREYDQSFVRTIGVHRDDRHGAIVERLLTPEAAAGVQQHNDWPRLTELDEETASNVEKRERAFPHGGVTVLGERSDTGTFELRRAFYLPLLEQRPDQACKGRWSWVVIVHGYCFVDHGRRRWLKEVKSATDEVRCRWNELVLSQATWPCLLPAVSKVIEVLSADDALPLVDALARNDDVKAARHWWNTKMVVWPAFENGWQLRDDSDDVLVRRVPRPAQHVREFARQIFAEDGLVFVVDGDPLLRGRELGRWEQDEVNGVVERLEGRFWDGANLAYLVRWIDSLPDAMRGAAARRTLWKACAAGAFPRGGEIHGIDEWTRLAACASADHGVMFAPRSLAEVFCEFAGAHAASDALVLPDDLRADRAMPAALAADQVGPFIAWLATRDGDPYDRMLQFLLLSIGPGVLELDGCRIPVLSARQQAVRRVSPPELRELAERGQLLVRVEEQLGDIRALFDAVADPGFDLFVLRVERRTQRDQWGEFLELGDAGADEVVRPLLADPAPALHGPARRTELLRYLLGGERNQAGVRAVRYVLHGSQDHARDADTELWTPVGALNANDLRPVAQRLLDQAPHAWRLLAAELLNVAGFDQQWRTALHVVDLDGRGLANHLLALNEDDLAHGLNGATPETRARMLRAVGDCPGLARRLPAHELPNGGFVAACDQDVFRVGRYPVPLSLHAHVRQVRPFANEAARELQSQLVDLWSPDVQLQVAAEHAIQHPTLELAIAILDACGAGADPEVARGVAWIPLGDGAFASPENLTDGVPAALRPDCLRAQAQVLAEIREHAAWHPFAPNRSASFRRVYREIDADAYAIANNREAVATLLGAAREAGLEGIGDDLAWRLLLGTPQDVIDEVIGTFVGNPGQDAWLRRLGAVANGGNIEVFESFLAVAIDEGHGPRIVQSELNLPCADGEWRRPGSIARCGNGLVGSARLDERVARYFADEGGGGGGQLEEVRADHEPVVPQGEPAAAAGVLEDFFQPWRERSASPRAVGAFVAMLGGAENEGIDGFVQAWLGDMDRAQCVNQLREGWANEIAPAEEALFRLTRTAVCVAGAGDLVHVLALDGQPMPAELAADGEDYELIVGRPPPPGGERSIVLRRPPDDFTSAEMNDALRRGVVTLLRQLGRIPGEVFGERWGRYFVDAAEEVRVARRTITRALPETLRYLSCVRNPTLRQALDRLKNAESAVDRVLEQEGDAGDARMQVAQHQQALLRVALEQREFLLERLRARLASAQYRQEQVVFELFQNADDAIVQRHGTRLQQVEPDQSRCAHISCREQAGHRVLRFSHRGRVINDAHVDGLGGNHGYERDLVNMLLPNASDKNATDDPDGAAGQFGLGFKSVHLIADEPRIFSGNIACRIVAGFIPEPCERPADLAPDATTFELPLLANPHPDRVLAEFLRWAPLLLIFSNGISVIKVEDGGQKRAFAWAPERTLNLDDGVCVQVGRDFLAVLCEHEARRYAVAIKMVDGVPDPLGAELPTVWVTAPLSDTKFDAGVALGGPFEVDVGRSRIAGEANDKNIHVARELGRILALAVTRLAEHPAFSHGDDFWRGLWRVLAQGAQIENPLLRAIHREGRGLSALAALRVPTELPGDWNQFTSVGQAEWYAEPREMVEVLDGLREMAPELPRKGKVVAESVHQTLNAIGCGRRQRFDVGELCRKLDLAMPNGVVTGSWVDALLAASGRPVLRDHEEWKNWLHERAFPAANDAFATADYLLIPELPDDFRSRELEDQAARARFAPLQYVLSREWCEGARLSLFLICRRRLEVGKADQLRAWAQNIGDDPQAQQAAREYAARGEYGGSFRSVLHHCNWANAEDRNRVALLEETAAALAARPIHWEEAADPAMGIADLLNEMAERFQRPPDYDRRVFGCDELILAVPPDADPLNAGERAAWLALFTRAALFRWGRTVDEQHQGFMERAWSNGWFGAFANAPDQALVNVLNEFQDDAAQEPPFMNWLYALMFTHWFARYLDDYVSHLADVNTRADDENLGGEALVAELDARVAPRQEGGGYDLPPISVLHYGTSFVIRELLIRNVINAAGWQGLAFPTVLRLRNFATPHGANIDGDRHLLKSLQFHAWLAEHTADATLGGGYDLAILQYLDGV